MTSQSFPLFDWQGVVLDYAGLQFNPCNDLIFPSVIRADCLRNAPAPYLMYYAPHDAPGGICVAAAERPAGPWHELPGNPVIAHEWDSHYRVSHVCSPHAVWNEEEERLFLYFHGENTTTRYATSVDGVHFEYGGVAVTDDQVDCTIGAFYARVFRHRLPGRDSTWIMLFMAHVQDRSGLFLAWSKDGRSWQTRREPVLLPDPPIQHLCAPWFCERDGRFFIVCHADTPIGQDRHKVMTDIVAYETDASFSHPGFAQRIPRRDVAGQDNLRISDPCFLEEDGTLYLFHTIGTRLNQRIALATATAG